jgi:hypothetical protein
MWSSPITEVPASWRSLAPELDDAPGPRVEEGHQDVGADGTAGIGAVPAVVVTAADASPVGDYASVGSLPSGQDLGDGVDDTFVKALMQGGQSNPESEKVIHEAAKASQAAAKATMMEGLEGHEKMILAAAQQGDGKFDIRGALGQLFSRSVGKSPEYKQAKSHTDKAKFRAEWAAAKWKTIEEDHMHTRTHTKIKKVKGTFVCFMKIVENEGGKDDPKAWLAAAKYGSKCLTMGPPWTAYNTMTERVDFMLIERSEEDVFQEAWQHTRTGTASLELDKAPAAAALEPGVGTPQKVAEPTSSRKRGATGEVTKGASGSRLSAAKGADSAAAGGEAKGGNKPAVSESTSLKKEVTKALGELSKTKAKFASASSSMRTLLERINATVSWQWANTDTLTKKLKTMRSEEASLMADVFNNEVMTSDVGELRKSNKDEGALLQFARKFNTEFGGLAANMEKEVKTLMHMHRLQATDSL